MTKRMPSSPTAIGIVQDVTGSTVGITMNQEVVGLSFVDGSAYRIGQIGSFIRIPIGYVSLYGVVSQVGASAVPDRLSDSEIGSRQWMTVQLIGEGRPGETFSRGLSLYPVVGDAAHLVTEQDLRCIYGRPDDPALVPIGRLSGAETLPAVIDLNRLVVRHSAVLGATGSGKTTAVAALLESATDPEAYPSARAVVLDLHGEYASALEDRSSVLRAGSGEAEQADFFIPYWAMAADELIAVTFGHLDDKDRAVVLDRVVELKRASLETTPRKGVTVETVTADSPVPFSVHALWFGLYEEVHATHTAQGTGQSAATRAYLPGPDGKPVQPGDPVSVIPPRYRPQDLSQGANPKVILSASTLNIRRQLDLLASRMRDRQLSFLFGSGPWLPDLNGVVDADLDALLEVWIGGPRAITILDVSAIPTGILDVVLGAMLRILYDGLFWARNLSDGGRERPVLLVLEEAHAYLKQGSSGLAATIVQRVVKEGRKYGVGAMIVSQRPSEVDATILSQCGTLVALRLPNPTDRSHVTSTVSDSLEGLLSALPILRTGEAIITGESVQLPMRVLIQPPAAGLPNSCDPQVVDVDGPGGWTQKRSPSDYATVVEAWRGQTSIIGEVIAMERTPVESSSAVNCGYDEEASILEIEFKKSGVYQYFDVPRHEYEALMAAESFGTYLNASIKGAYRYARV